MTIRLVVLSNGVLSNGAALFLSSLLAWLAPSSQLRAEIVVSRFEEQTLTDKLDPVDNVYKGEVGSPGSFRSGNVEFSNDGHYFTEYAGVMYDSWSGTGVSRKTSLSQGEFWEHGNDLVITPASVGDAPNTWGVIYYSATLQADTGYLFDSLAITNTAYTSYVIAHDQNYGGPAFTDGDFFAVTFTNPDTNTSIEYALADYRSQDPTMHYVVSDWATVPLGSLNASKLIVSFTGSRDDPVNGLATPTYAAIDDVSVRSSVSAVPEPSSLALLAASGSIGVWFRWRKSKRSQRSTQPLLG